MGSLRRPSLADRTMSSPLSLNTSPEVAEKGRVAPLSRFGFSILTPPPSPRGSRHSRSSSNLSNKTDDSLASDHFVDTPFNPRKSSLSTSENYTSIYNAEGILLCPYEVDILKDQRGRDQSFGHGAWSTVFKGTCRHGSSSGVLTPPLLSVATPPLLVAVKQPARKDAKAILESEAKVLSLLMRKPGNEQHVVSFLGFQQSDSSIVLAAIPLSLDSHIRSTAALTNASRTTWNMSEPAIGSISVWLDLTYKLVSALCWLHSEAMVVHGDIKPGNILLDRRLYIDDMDTTSEGYQFPYEPLFADFSSSQQMDSTPTANTLSAVTREYTAPELLSSKVLSNPNSTATTASDVFSLAVTLLVAATGNPMVYSGSVYQRQAMATQGWMVLQAVRNGPMEEGARVPRKGVVERTLNQAVLKVGTGRIESAEWKSNVEDIIRQEMNKS